MTDADLAVFLIVLALRLLVPLGILRFPLPAIVAALIIDAVDQTIFQTMTDIDLEAFNYQGYDKALDIFYLTIAYISTFRNWRSETALTVALALWYYRLVGVTLFELTGWRPLLIIFPNTFEYFFIFIAIVLLRWTTERLSSRQIVLAAGAVWVFIKLPQEFWIHIAQLDTTDVLKQDVFGVDPSAGWGTAFSNRPLVSVLVVAVIAAMAWLVRRQWQRLPAPEHELTFDADRLPTPTPSDGDASRPWHDGLIEKIVLLALVTIIFANALGETTATATDIAVGVAALVVGNALLTQFVRRFDVSWASAGRSFAMTVAINVVVLAALRIVSPSEQDRTFLTAAFFLLLLSLIIVLFDRYHPSRPELRSLRSSIALPRSTAPSR